VAHKERDVCIAHDIYVIKVSGKRK